MFVSSSEGSDTEGTGAEDAPFASIARGVAAFRGSSVIDRTVLVADGKYTLERPMHFTEEDGLGARGLHGSKCLHEVWFG
jgi:hypothetical protein